LGGRNLKASFEIPSLYLIPYMSDYFLGEASTGKQQSAAMKVNYESSNAAPL